VEQGWRPARGGWGMNLIEPLMFLPVLIVWFAMQVASVVVGLVIWERFLRRR
jgi:hypothetical protein